jgi:homoserine O-acetyltransferase
LAIRPVGFASNRAETIVMGDRQRRCLQLFRFAAADPANVLYSLKSSADYDPEPGVGKIKAKLFALNFGDDEFNPDELNLLETLTPRVKNGRYVVQPGSPDSFGHLTMAHPDLWSKHVAEFMHELGD